MYDQAITDRFWSKVDKSGGPDACWPWMAGRKKAGYGQFFVRRDPPGAHGQMFMANAHKFAYILTHGPVTNGMVVRHQCDNPPCCNPAHLILGTMADNVADAIERGQWDPAACGRKSLPSLLAHNATRRMLTEYDIAMIIVAKASGRTLAGLADEYGMVITSLYRLYTGTAYKENPLVQRLAELHKQGIRFPYYRGKTTPDTIHPALKAIAADAAKLVKRYDEAVAKQVARPSYEVAVAELLECF